MHAFVTAVISISTECIEIECKSVSYNVESKIEQNKLYSCCLTTLFSKREKCNTNEEKTYAVYRKNTVTKSVYQKWLEKFYTNDMTPL